MPKQIVPVTGLADVGLVTDVPPVSLPPNAFSDCNNVRFRDGAVQKMEGDLNILPYLNYAAGDVIRYVAWWPSPNLAFANAGYYVIVVQQTRDNAAGEPEEFDNAYIVQPRDLGVELDEPDDPTTEIADRRTVWPNLEPTNRSLFKGSFLPNGQWQHTFFQGGFTIILNNGLETPRFLSDVEGNISTADVGTIVDPTVDPSLQVRGFAPLPNWDSYAAEIRDDNGNIVQAQVATVTAGVIRDFGDFLVAGNLVERNSMNEVIRGLPGVVRSSDIAGPGQIPQNWNPFAQAVNTADEFTLTNDGIVQDMVQLQGNLYIYSNSSISVMSRTNNPAAPLSVRTVTDAYGALTTDSVLEFDGRHFVVGSQDVYIFGGHPGSIKSIADGRVRRHLYENLNPLAVNQTFVLRYQQKDEIWICYSTADAVPGTVSRALIWNYRLNNWTQRDLPNVLTGDVGPIPGGGVPTGTTRLEGDRPGSGGLDDNGKIETLGGEVKRFTIQDTALQTLQRTNTGLNQRYTIRVQGDLPGTVATQGLPVYYITFSNDFSTSMAAPLNFQAAGQNTAGGYLRLTNTEEFNFNIRLNEDISFDSTLTTSFAEQVTYPILRLLTANSMVSWPRGRDALANLPDWFSTNRPVGQTTGTPDWTVVNRPDAPVRVHLSSEDNVLVVTFEPAMDNGTRLELYQTILRLDGTIQTYIDPADPDVVRSMDNDLPSIHLTEFDNFPDSTSNGVAGANRVYQYYLHEGALTTDNIDNFIFYPQVPDGAVMYFGTRPQLEPQTVLDGGARTTDTPALDGGERTADTPVQDGGVRRRWDFTDGGGRFQVVGPITGRQIRERLLEYNMEFDAAEFRLQVWHPDAASLPDSVPLHAYNFPPLTAMATHTPPTVAQQTFQNINVDDGVQASDPPVLDFSFRFQEFFRSVQDAAWDWYVPSLQGRLPVSPRMSSLLRVVDESEEFISPYSIGTFNPILDWLEDPMYSTGEQIYRTVIGATGTAADVKLGVAQNITHVFQSNPDSLLRAGAPVQIGSSTDYDISITSEDPAAVRLVMDPVGSSGVVEVGTQAGTDALKGLTISHLTRAEFDRQASGFDANIVIIEENQGRHATTLAQSDIDNASPINPVRFYLPPIVQIQNTNPLWVPEAFSAIVPLNPVEFADPTFEPRGDDGWLQLIGDAIVRETTLNSRPLLSRLVDDNSLEVTALDFTFQDIDNRVQNEEGTFLGDRPDSTGAETDTNDRVTVGALRNVTEGFIYPAERRIGNIGIALVSTGNSVVVGGDLFAFSDSNLITSAGEFANVLVPTYTVIQVSDPLVTAEAFPMLPTTSLGSRVYIFETSEATTLEGYIQNLIAQVNVRIPTVVASTQDNLSIDIEPTTFTDASNFVLQFLINDTLDDIQTMVNLTDDLQFAQDSNNPIILGAYVERLRPFGMASAPRVSRYHYLSQGTFVRNNMIATADVSLGTGASAVDRAFDILRPWPRTQVNFAREFPIFSAARFQADGTVSNKILASDIGFSRPSFEGDQRRVSFSDEEFRFQPVPTSDMSPRQDDPISYESYIEREQFGITPEFDTETLNSVAMWTDGSTLPFFRSTHRLKNALEIQVNTTNATGQPVTGSPQTNLDYIGDDYKTDIRRTGRFMNIRITDGIDDIQTEAPEVTGIQYDSQSTWFLSGLQLDIGKAGTR